MQYSQEIKEVAMAAMRAGPQILEEHLAVEAIVKASRADAATPLAALNDSSWCFLEATAGAFDEDNDVFSQRARAYLNSRASRLVPCYAPIHNRALIIHAACTITNGDSRLISQHNSTTQI